MIVYEKHETFGLQFWSLDLAPGFAAPGPGKCVNLMLAAPERRTPTIVNHSDVVFGFRHNELVFVGKVDALLTPKGEQALLIDPVAPDAPIVLGAVRVRALGIERYRLREPEWQALADKLLDAHAEASRHPALGLSHVAWRMASLVGNQGASQVLDLATTHRSPEEQAYLAAEPVKRWP